jgi:hypothetical protein
MYMVNGRQILDGSTKQSINPSLNVTPMELVYDRGILPFIKFNALQQFLKSVSP